ncbi:MAG: DUF47 family protein [Dehalobacterium sp.]
MFKFSSKDDKFYDLFILFAKKIHDSAERLKDFVDDLENAEQGFAEIKELEIKCDQTLHRIFKELNKSFITPIDREDIYTIGKQMDDIADFIEATASRFVMFNIKIATPEAKELSNLVIQGTQQVIQLMEELKIVNKSKKLVPTIVEINRLEEEVDEIFRKAVRKLFSEPTPVVDVIKWKEIYEHLENILDACEDVANTVEGVVMKHA